MLPAIFLAAAALVAPAQHFAVDAVVDVYDGDTATLDIRVEHGGNSLGLVASILRFVVRIQGIDTPERNRLATREAAMVSRGWLLQRMTACEDLTVLASSTNGMPTTGKFGRLLGVPWCGEIDLVQEMLRLRLGRPYNGGAR